MHDSSPFWYKNSKKNFWRGGTPRPQIPPSVARGREGVFGASILARLVLDLWPPKLKSWLRPWQQPTIAIPAGQIRQLAIAPIVSDRGGKCIAWVVKYVMLLWCLLIKRLNGQKFWRMDELSLKWPHHSNNACSITSKYSVDIVSHHFTALPLKGCITQCLPPGCLSGL